MHTEGSTSTPRYQTGFGNDLETEALSGALPLARDSPQKCACGLYAEQLSGTAFPARGHANERTRCYRIHPSVLHAGRYRRVDSPQWISAPCADPHIVPLGQYRWDPVPHGDVPLTRLTGVRTMTIAGT